MKPPEYNPSSNDKDGPNWKDWLASQKDYHTTYFKCVCGTHFSLEDTSEITLYRNWLVWYRDHKKICPVDAASFIPRQRPKPVTSTHPLKLI